MGPPSSPSAVTRQPSPPASPPDANGLRRVDAARPEALYSVQATRRIESGALARLPEHTLMQRAGQAVARLARALQPHAHCLWIACGPGNNGGDGLVAATELHRRSLAYGGRPRVVVTHWAGERGLPGDAQAALDRARQAGVVFAEQPPPAYDLAIDALLGIGAARPVQGPLGEWLAILRRTPQPVLCVDLPSGLDADTGRLAPAGTGNGRAQATTPGPRHTLSLLTLKPGLFTASGRDAAGQVWFDGLGVTPPADEPVAAWLAGHGAPPAGKPAMAHASHKGTFGDVVVLGGQGIAVAGAGMTGAAVLAARAALHAGAGRVFVGLLQPAAAGETGWDPGCPELMFRRPEQLFDTARLQAGCWVCGCGGGERIAAFLPRTIGGAERLVLDADALNAIAGDDSLKALLGHRGARGRLTVLTPHPLEASRLLSSSTAAVMDDRLGAAQALADRYGALCVLKGSGTVIAVPGETPRINPTGNAALATAGTGDVLAGMIGCALARPLEHPRQALPRVAAAVFQHGWLADHWPASGPGLSASALAALAHLRAGEA